VGANAASTFFCSLAAAALMRALVSSMWALGACPTSSAFGQPSRENERATAIVVRIMPMHITTVTFTSIQPIRFDDVDGAGIVYYPRFLHLCHAAFEDFFNAAAPFSYPALIRDRRRGFPTVHIDADFKAPLQYGDTAVVSVGVVRVGSSSMTMQYRIHRKHDSVLSFQASITTVFIDLDSQKSTPIPAEIVRVLQQYLSV
jgi:4-hydroxybenzoyl-CoA thioesterase